jgi:transposase
MIVVRHPTAEEVTELKRMTRQEIGRVARRAQMVLLSAQERTVPEIAAIFAVNAKTVRLWIRRFNGQGPAGLYDAPRSGRPRKLTDPVRAALIDLIQADPAQFGYLATFWTVAMLVLALAKQVQAQLSPSSVRQVLKRLGLRWGRPRLAMPHKVDPHKAAKQWAVAQAVIDAGAKATLLYADESRLALLPLVGAKWH